MTFKKNDIVNNGFGQVVRLLTNTYKRDNILVAGVIHLEGPHTGVVATEYWLNGCYKQEGQVKYLTPPRLEIINNE